MAPRGILFDFNGVIVDDERHHCAALIATLAEHGIALTEADYYRHYLGYDDRGCFAHAWRESGRTLTGSTLQLLVQRKAERYAELIRGSLTLVPGAEAFIRAATGEGLLLGIVSGALRREIELVLDVAGLHGAFGPIVAAEDVAACKPDPEGYRRGLAALALPAADVVVIEDSLPGLAAARATGLACQLLATSHPAAELRDRAPVWDDLSGHHPRELPWS
ncbi:MAG TPA: HAD family phosphatase [Gemmatimonadales bacterium]|jgi:HAD superfamily hydrolase (TIGR01509 family)|nr:HAD family phosphatase [Gemmatimonadales bacterium]